jgi:hypothetical protein
MSQSTQEKKEKVYWLVKQTTVEAAMDNCTLHFLSQRLYLSTFLVASDTTELWHWLNHYIHVLGARPENAVVFIRHGGTFWSGADSQLAETLATARAFGVGARVIDAPPSDLTRFTLINEHIRQVAAANPGAWYVYADVDELFAFPCTTEAAVAAAESPSRDPSRHEQLHPSCFTSTMCDMLAADGAVRPLGLETPINEQYPVGCRLRQLVGRLNVHKITLFRTTSAQKSCLRDFGSPHAISEVRGIMREHARRAHMYGSTEGGINRTSGGTASPSTEMKEMHHPPSRRPCTTSVVQGCHFYPDLVRHYTMTARSVNSTHERARHDLSGESNTTWNQNSCGHPVTHQGQTRCADYDLLWRLMRVRTLPNSRPPKAEVCPGWYREGGRRSHCSHLAWSERSKLFGG